MAEAFASSRWRAAGIIERMVDLLPTVRNHVYRPDFNGSFGLNSMLPALTGPRVLCTRRRSP
jgi:hypothetical protein